MESAARRLELLEKQGEMWRKYYEDEEQRIEDEYQRGLAEIKEAHRKAITAIRLEFSIRRDEVKRQFSGENAKEESICSSIITTTGPSKPLSVCTSCPSKAVFTQKPTSTIQSKHILNRTTNTVYVSRAVGRAHSKGDENDEKDGIGWWYCSTDQRSTISSVIQALQSTKSYSSTDHRPEMYIGLKQYSGVNYTIIAILLVAYDPGGTFTRVHPCDAEAVLFRRLVSD